jgi:hypothetical protein
MLQRGYRGGPIKIDDVCTLPEWRGRRAGDRFPVAELVEPDLLAAVERDPQRRRIGQN